MLLKLALPLPLAPPLVSFSPKLIPFSHPLKPLLSFNNSVKCRHSQPATPTPHSVEALPPRVFVNHSIYKGKAALTLTPRPPEFAPLEMYPNLSGPYNVGAFLQSGAFKVSKEGHVLLQFAPAVGMRQYDWERKQIFSLSVGEMGTIISLGVRDSCEFFHDPFKCKSDEGKVRKVLKVEPLPDGSGHSFKLSVQNKLLNVDENIYIPVTKAEIAVLSSIFNFIIPYMIGWHTFANSIKPDESNEVNNNSTPRYGGDYEWNR